MEQIKWTKTNYLYGSYKYTGLDLHNQVAGFDLDSTLIVTKSGKKFPIDSEDWKWFSPNVVDIIKSFSKTHNIIIFTNQKTIGSNETKTIDWMKKLQAIVTKLDVSIQIYASLKSDLYRKPYMTMFEIATTNIKKLDLEQSFYCGDAAGRPSDFADTDLKFALNSKIKFKLPEELFLTKTPADIKKELTNIKVSYPIDFEEKEIDFTNTYPEFKPAYTADSGKNELIIMCGFPGSGKTSYVKKNIVDKHAYEWINQDTLKTLQKCLKATQTAILAKSNIVIDNTNLDVETRKKYIDLATKAKYTCRCILFNIDIGTSKHNMNFRHLVSKGTIDRIPDIVYNIFNKKYVKPVLSEGFESIEIINFTPNVDANVRNLYCMYYF
jgi:bifunctional polynucleotide phosphatase/kinase